MSERWVCKRCFTSNDGSAASCVQCGLLRGSEVPAVAPGQPDQPAWQQAAAPRQQQGWTRWLRFAWIPIVAIVVLVGILSTARRDDGGAITDAGTVEINDLRVGDCFDSAPDIEEISQVDGKPCTEPHEYELFHVATWTGSEDYPTDSDMEQLIIAECLPAFESWVGLAYEQSIYDIFWTAPTQGAWDAGDRLFQCAIYEPGNTQLTASVRGSGR